MDFYGFYTGTEFRAYEYLGAHYHNGKTIFRTFAPAALEISVIGEFNNWTETPMHKTFDSNFWECEIDGTKPEQMYKYRIYKRNGKVIDHCDPYGYYSELRPANASRIYDLSQFKFTDEKWIYNQTKPKIGILTPSLRICSYRILRKTNITLSRLCRLTSIRAMNRGGINQPDFLRQPHDTEHPMNSENS